MTENMGFSAALTYTLFLKSSIDKVKVNLRRSKLKFDMFVESSAEYADGESDSQCGPLTIALHRTRLSRLALLAMLNVLVIPNCRDFSVLLCNCRRIA